jgi:cobaltochelatase CobN
MDAATQTAVANEYIKATVDYGVVCCHHTCANLEFNKWVAKASSASSATLKAYAKIMQAATGKDIGLVSNDPSTPSQGGSPTGENGQSSSTEDNGQSSYSNSQSSASTQSKESSDSSASESTTGSISSHQKAYEVSKNSQGSSDSTGVSFFAILGIIGLLGLFGVGYYRKNI